jgi:hypothetical protein
MVRSQPRQTVHETLSQKHPWQRKAGGVAQGVGSGPYLKKKTFDKEGLVEKLKL